MRGRWGNPLSTDYDAIALTMAQEKIATSAMDVLELDYSRFLEWIIQLEVRMKAIKKTGKK